MSCFNMIVTVFILVSLFVAVRQQDLIRTCPPPEDIPQCSCHQTVNFRMYCKELYNPYELKAISTKLSKYAVYQLRLDDSILMYWPKNMFSRLHIKEIEMYNCEVLGMESENGTEMFQGIESSLRRLYFYNVTGMDAWRWSTFAIFKSLNDFIIRRGDLTSIRKDFSAISPESLKTVHLAYNKIKYIHKDAFANHVAIETWELPGNEIAEITRAMLPIPATQLQRIELYENKIVTIPDDFFSDMPKLKYVFIWGNGIKFLSHEMFQPMENGHPFILDVRQNNMFCCESLKFLVNASYQEFINGACHYPRELNGKAIRSLTEANLDHGLC